MPIPLRHALLSVAFAVLGPFARCQEMPVAERPATERPATERPATELPVTELPVTELHGRLEEHAGLRVLRLWGTPAERGYAHGRLLGLDITAMLRLEFAARFGRKPALLQQVRGLLPRLIEYPEPVQHELDALWRGIVDSGADLQMAEFDRALDQKDLLLANALDVFGLLACSSFTVFGEQVAGGGVLTGRNFDWPLTGEHMIQRVLLVVQTLEDGQAIASVSWPGYVGTVTGVSKDGMFVCLHVGSATVSMTPEPGSWPAAIAARRILERGATGGAESVFADALRAVQYTSPPVGYLTHVVLPAIPEKGPPLTVFEADTEACEPGTRADGPFVLTNHFRTRTGGRGASRDSLDREKRLTAGIAGCMATDDRVVDIAEAWSMLESVQRGGGHAFATLHSLLFRHEPWLFELRLAEHEESGIVAAPVSSRRYVLRREQVFAPGDTGATGR